MAIKQNFGAVNVINPFATLQQGLAAAGDVWGTRDKLIAADAEAKAKAAQQAIDNARTSEMLKLQQAQDVRAQSADTRAQTQEERAAAAEALKIQQAAALQQAALNTPMNTLYSSTGTTGLDADIGESIAKRIETTPNITTADFTSIGDAANARLLEMEKLKSKVIDSKDYGQRLGQNILAQGGTLAEANKAAKEATELYKTESVDANKDLLKAKQKMVGDTYNVESKALSDRYKLEADRKASSKSTKDSKGKLADQTELLKDLQKRFPETDWSFGGTKDFGGKDLTDFTNKLVAKGYTADEIDYAITSSSSGTADAWLDKAPEVAAQGVRDRLAEAVALRATPGALAAAGSASTASKFKAEQDALQAKVAGQYQSIIDQYGNSRQLTENDYRNAALGSLYKGVTTPSVASVGTSNGTVPDNYTEVQKTIQGIEMDPKMGYQSARKDKTGEVITFGAGQFQEARAKEVSDALGMKWDPNKKFHEQEWASTPANQDKMLSKQIEMTVGSLNKEGIVPTGVNVFMAHNQGVAGVSKILKAAENGTALDTSTASNVRNNLPNAGKGIADKDLANAYITHYGAKFMSSMPGEYFPAAEDTSGKAILDAFSKVKTKDITNTLAAAPSKSNTDNFSSIVDRFEPPMVETSAQATIRKAQQADAITTAVSALLKINPNMDRADIQSRLAKTYGKGAVESVLSNRYSNIK